MEVTACAQELTTTVVEMDGRWTQSFTYPIGLKTKTEEEYRSDTKQAMIAEGKTHTQFFRFNFPEYFEGN